MVGVWVRVICRPEDGMSGRILQTTPSRFATAPASGGGVGVGVCLVQTAVLHHYGTAAERSDVGVVGDDDHGGTVVPRGGHENAHDLAAGGLVERAGRLVGEDDRRLYGKRAGR